MEKFNEFRDKSKISGKWTSIIIFSMTLFILSLFITSCNELPPYTRPSVDMPSGYRDAYNLAIKPDPNQVKEVLGDLFWWEFFQDDVLKDYIAVAIAQNYDLKLAVERITEAQANLGLARANQFPTLQGNGAYNVGKISEVGPTPVPPGAQNNSYSFNVGLLANYEVDFWGQYRYATAAARASMLATIEGKNVVVMTLVSEVASTYFKIRELDLELAIAKQTLESRRESLTLVTAREECGIATMLDVDQSKGLVLVAEKTITNIEKEAFIQENYLRNLMGKNPGPIKRGKDLGGQLKQEPIPPGLPSSLLENRPDIRQAEFNLFAANANIGVARSAYYPQIILTGQAGTLSKDFSNLFSDRSYFFNFATNIYQMIFDGGQRRSNVNLTESQKRQAVLQYQNIVVAAFREVSDAIINYQKSKEYLKQQTELSNTLEDQSNLARLRYEGGVSSYLEVLDTERQYFEAELERASAECNVLLYVIQIYKSLGGGWKQISQNTVEIKKDVKK